MPIDEADHNAESLVNLTGGQFDRKWWVLLAIGLGTFMAAMDGSIVNTILPVISQSFDADIATIEWVVVVYLLVLSGLMLSFGRLGDLRGHRNLYVIGFTFFLVSSALCGLAPSIGWLIGFRAFQAVGGAMLAANSPAILTKNFPSTQRGQALGMQATMTYLGLTVGPVLGGLLADQFGWRSVFYINLPVAAAAIIISLVFIPQDKPETVTEKFDPLGAGLFITGLTALLFGLNQGHTLGWSSPVILGLLFTGLVLLGVFVFVEGRIKYPILDLSLFTRSRIFSGAVSSALLNYICIYSIIFLMPFYLISGRHLTPSQAGLLLSSQPIIMAVVAPLSGTLSDRTGTRWPSVFGMLILAAGIFLLARLDETTSLPQVALALVVVGTGTGIFISPNNSALMGSAPRNRQGIAAGILATSRNTGMALGIGISGAIFTTTLTRLAATSGAMFTAIHYSFLFIIPFALLGALTSAMRVDHSK